jgi:hypothetical protein
MSVQEPFQFLVSATAAYLLVCIFAFLLFHWMSLIKTAEKSIMSSPITFSLIFVLGCVLPAIIIIITFVSYWINLSYAEGLHVAENIYALSLNVILCVGFGMHRLLFFY